MGLKGGVMDDSLRQRDDSCLGSTCLKWTGDGELSAVDLHHVLELLSASDSSVSVLGTCSMDEQGSYGDSAPQD